MKRTDLKFIGIDGWDRPVYQDPNGLLWKDTTLGSDTPSFASACNNEFEGTGYAYRNDISRFRVVMARRNPAIIH